MATLDRAWGAVKRGAAEQVSRAYRSVVERKKLPLLTLGDDAFDALADEHAESLERWATHLDAALDAAASRDLEDLSFQGRAEWRGIWASVLDTTLALDRVKVFHEHFPAVSPTKRLSRHARAFALSFGAYTAQIAAALRLVRLTEKHEGAARLLDEPAPEHDLPARCFARMKWNALHVVDVAKLAAGESYLETMAPVVRKTRLGGAILERLGRTLAGAKGALKEKGARWFAENGLAILKGKLFRAWFPLQKGVACWMSETKLKKRAGPLVSSAQIRSLARRLEPGDILVERRNWNLSNIGLPGFWPHAALYVGRPEQHGEELRRNYPAAWKRWLEPHEDGNARVIVEALSPGVILNSLEKSAGADYVGALRPRLPAFEKSLAVARALHYLGRPYDYDFDFLSDSALVCSELLYKCYQPGRDMSGLPFELVPVAGRRVLPPTEIVAQFDRGTVPLEFVAFFDGVERRGEAAERAEPDFRRSHRRPKWDFVQP